MNEDDYSKLYAIYRYGGLHLVSLSTVCLFLFSRFISGGEVCDTYPYSFPKAVCGVSENLLIFSHFLDLRSGEATRQI